MSPLLQELRQVGGLWFPRLLTQVCRDPTSPTYGCFDRNWWHYRMRDFPSIILQQGAYALFVASRLEEYRGMKDALVATAAAACRFWNRRACRHGAFEEYYPWEEGYPPLAFSTLAIAKLAAEGVVDTGEIRKGIGIAVAQLLTRFEGQAANQQVAGLAALAWCRRSFPELVSERDFNTLVERTLALQKAEGWFEEYGGPDLGYLSVTIDCLLDLFDATGNRAFFASAERAADWIGLMIGALGTRGIGMHNSRNTDYMVPYGLVRLSLARGESGIVEQVFGSASDPKHFLQAIDDRYISHYCGHSLFRAMRLLEENPHSAPAARVKSPREPLDRITASGHYINTPTEDERLIVTLRKGGIFSYYCRECHCSDFGWIVETGSDQLITHWWSDEWTWGRTDSGLWIEGPLYRHREVLSTPWRHMALRLSSRIAGRRLIAMLKRKLIFHRAPSAFRFRRTLSWQPGRIRVVDVFTGLAAGARLIPGPRSSKRHVASADSFHLEDLVPMNGFHVSRDTASGPGGVEVISVYTLQ